MKNKYIRILALTGASLFTIPMLSAAENPALMEPVKSVYVEYIDIQTALAKDSLAGVSENATALAKAIQGDPMKMLPPEVARQAANLARAKDLASARAALKPLSNSLIGYLAQKKVTPGPYYQAYCPMAKASWLQADRTLINNPYMGKSMATCGQILPQFTVPKSAAPSGHAEHAPQSGHSGHNH